jgi:hypothetical protein
MTPERLPGRLPKELSGLLPAGSVYTNNAGHGCVQMALASPL